MDPQLSRVFLVDISAEKIENVTKRRTFKSLVSLKQIVKWKAGH
jgi:hypothetical protein